MAFKIYTKTGDAGETALIGGTRIPKSHIRIEAYGTVDELNSWFGVIRDHIQDASLNLSLASVQNTLFVVGSQLATDPDKNIKMNLPALTDQEIHMLESSIDAMESKLPELKNFVLPGGHPASSFIHVARCVCRRAERICVQMQELEFSVQPIVIRYLNRLSDYFFILSRHLAQIMGATEVLWKGRDDKW